MNQSIEDHWWNFSHSSAWAHLVIVDLTDLSSFPSMTLGSPFGIDLWFLAVANYPVSRLSFGDLHASHEGADLPWPSPPTASKPITFKAPPLSFSYKILLVTGHKFFYFLFMFISSKVIYSQWLFLKDFCFSWNLHRRDHIREEQSLRICQGHPNIVKLQEVFQDDVSNALA